MELLRKVPKFRCTKNKLAMHDSGRLQIHLEYGVTTATDPQDFLSRVAPGLRVRYPGRKFALIPADSLGLECEFTTEIPQEDGSYCRYEPVGGEYKVLISKLAA